MNAALIQDVLVPAPFAASNLSSTEIPPGGTVTFTVTYRPGAGGGDAAIVTVSTDHGSVDATVTGSGLDERISVAPSSMSFGPQRTKTASRPRTVTIANTGSETVTVSPPSLSGANARDFALGAAQGFELQPNTSRLLTVSFKPIADGARSAALVVRSTACNAPTKTVKLSGTGAQPAIDVRPEEVRLSSQPGKEGAPVTLSVANVGNATLTVKDIAITSASASEFVLTGLPRLPVTVLPGDSFTFDLRFRPEGVNDPPPFAVIEITSDDAKSPVTHVPVEAVYASPSPSPSVSAAAPPPRAPRGPGLLDRLAGYSSALVVLAAVLVSFGALLALRRARVRRIVRRWTG